jgi:hypothetical protein
MTGALPTGFRTALASKEGAAKALLSRELLDCFGTPFP